MYSTVFSGALLGVSAFLVSVEVDIAQGLPGFSMVGSLGGEVKESRERVSVALKNAGFALPPRKITVNLSPADRRKDGSAFDLPIAAGMLEALEYVPIEATKGILFLGELSLDGEIKKVRGVLPIVREAVARGISQCVVPAANAREGAAIPGIKVRGASHIREVFRFLTEKDAALREKILPAEQADPNGDFLRRSGEKGLDFSDVCGQETAKRAAEIAAAGFHNLLMAGPPGAGKSMIAKRIPGILPPLTLEESLEVTTVASVAGILEEGHGLVTKRPFCSPHHTVSQSALVGGSLNPRPGMISLAHRGVLFLGGYFCKTAETPNLRALWRFSYLEFFKKSAKTILHTTFWNCVLPLFDCFFAERFMVADYLMAKPYTIWQKEETKWRNYTRMAKGEGAYGI